MKSKEDTFIIAEVAQAHDGSLGIAHSYIDALKHSGVDAVKFQIHIADAESSEFEKFRINFSYQDKTRFDYWKRMEFSLDQWKGLKEHCDEVGLEFIASPFSCAAVDLLEELNVSRYKIGSGEISNYLMLNKIGLTGKPIILSSGMSNIQEISATLEFLKPFGNPLCLLQCTTEYPTAPQKWGLKMINEFKVLFEIPTGYSDHSADPVACLAAVACGAQIIEFHVVFDKRMFGPDAIASITIDEVTSLVKGVRKLDIAFSTEYNKDDNNSYEDLKNNFGKSICVNKALSKGHIITLKDLESKKPFGHGIAPVEFKNVIGRTLNNDLREWDFLLYSHLV